MGAAPPEQNVTVFWAGALYAFFSLDHFLFGPFLLSRPLIVGPAVGAVMGCSVDGLALGVLGEAVWALVPPAGPRQWDTGLMTALSVVWAGDSGLPHAPLWAWAGTTALALPFGGAGRILDRWTRRGAGVCMEKALGGLKAGREGPLVVSLWGAGALWVLKSGAFFALCYWTGGLIWKTAAARFSPSLLLGLERMWYVWVGVGAAVVFHQFVERLTRPGVFRTGGA